MEKRLSIPGSYVVIRGPAQFEVIGAGRIRSPFGDRCNFEVTVGNAVVAKFQLRQRGRGSCYFDLEVGTTIPGYRIWQERKSRGLHGLAEVTSTGRFFKQHFRPSSDFDRHSFRYRKVWKKGQREPHLILVACEEGDWGGGRCSSSMKLVHVLHPCREEPRRCRRLGQGAVT